MAIPKQPRQQMINIMYLALTALLALNISSEVLNTFKLINDKLTDSNVAVEAKSASLMNLFQAKYNSNAAKTKPYMDDAQQVRLAVQDFFEHVEALKSDLIEKSGGMVDGKYKGAKNTDVTTRIMIEKRKGRELEERIIQLRGKLLTLPTLEELEPHEKNELGRQIALNNDYDTREAEKLGKKSWANYNFERVPVIASVTLLAKLQADAKESEARILEKLYNRVDSKSFTFEDLSAKVITSNQFVLTNRQEFNANIFFAATSKTQEVDVFIGQFKPHFDLREADGNLKNQVEEFPLIDGFVQLNVEDGIARFHEIPQQSGDRKKEGVIKIKKPDGSGHNFYPFELSYHSAQPAAVVSPEKINVLYAGVENPLSVSVPGFPAEKVKAYLASGNGNLSGKEGRYVAKMNSIGRAKIAVHVIGDDGKEMKMTETEFRVKRIPNPVPKVGTLPGGEVDASVFRAQNKLNVYIPEFEFETKFNVLSYRMVWQRKNEDLIDAHNEGDTFSSKTRQIITGVKRGDIVYVENIRVRGPEGDTRKIQDVIYRIK